MQKYDLFEAHPNRCGYQLIAEFGKKITCQSLVKWSVREEKVSFGHRAHFNLLKETQENRSSLDAKLSIFQTTYKDSMKHVHSKNNACPGWLIHSLLI